MKENIKTLFVDSLQLPVIKLSGIDELIKLIEIHEKNYILWSKSISNSPDNISAMEMANSGTDMAFILQDGVAIAVQTSDFKNFNEMLSGYYKGFKTGNSFRKAFELEIESGEEYDNFVLSGFEKVSEYRKVIKTKSPDIFEIWKEFYNQLEPKEELPNPKDLNGFVQMDILGISGFLKSKPATIKDAYSKGFWLSSDYTKAKKLGFEAADNYFTAQDFEIESPEEFSILKLHGISDIQSWSDFCDFREEISESGYQDAFGFLFKKSINLLQAGRAIDIRSLKNIIINHVINKYGIQSGPYYSFVQNMTIQECQDFLCEHKDLSSLIYKSEDVLIRRHFSDLEKKTAVIDISNVILFFNNGSEERKADSSLLLIIADSLRKLGVENIIGFADANIHYDLSEEKISEINNVLDTLQIVKSSEPADIYILQFVQDNPSFIVSNDHYSDWCNDRHPWRIENIPRLLFTFEFDNEKNLFLDNKVDEF